MRPFLNDKLILNGTHPAKNCGDKINGWKIIFVFGTEQKILFAQKNSRNIPASTKNAGRD